MNAAGLGLKWYGIYVNDAADIDAMKFGIGFSDAGEFVDVERCLAGGFEGLAWGAVYSLDFVLDEPLSAGTHKIGCIQVVPWGVQTLDVVEHWSTSTVVRFADGEFYEVPYEHRGRVSFGPIGGYLPCTDVVPVRTVRWARVKADFR